MTYVILGVSFVGALTYHIRASNRVARSQPISRQTHGKR